MWFSDFEPLPNRIDQQNVWFSDFEHFKIDRNRTRTQGITTFPQFDTRRIRIWTNKTYGFLILITSKSIETVSAPKEEPLSRLSIPAESAFGPTKRMVL